MASKPLRPCLHPGCTALVRGGYCAQHQPKRAEHRSAESLAWRRWYSLPVWTDDLRPAQLLREPFCRECARCGLRVRATDVDHIVPFEGDWQKFTGEGEAVNTVKGAKAKESFEAPAAASVIVEKKDEAPAADDAAEAPADDAEAPAADAEQTEA